MTNVFYQGWRFCRFVGGKPDAFSPGLAVFPLCGRLNRRFTGYVGLNAPSSVHSKTPFPRFPHNVLQTPPTQEIPTLNTSPKTKCRSYAPQRGAPGAAGLSRAETIVPRQRYAPTHRTDDETPHLMHSERSNAVLASPDGYADPPDTRRAKAPGFQRGRRHFGRSGKRDP